MKTFAIAAVTLQELLRRRVQMNLLLFAAALLGAAALVSTLTLGEMHRILADLGLTAMQLVGTLLAVFLGASAIAGDLDRRVLYPVVAKPVSRSEYLLGRYLGLTVALLLNLLVMAVALAALLATESRSLSVVDAAFASAVVMQGVQLVVVAAVAILFSSLTTVTLAAIFSLAIAVAGHLTNEMRALWQGEMTWLPKLLWYLLPNLGSLTANEAVIYRTPPAAHAWLAVVYGALYAAAALALATLAFERRDFR